MDALSPVTRKFTAIGLLFVTLISLINLVLLPLGSAFRDTLAERGDAHFQRTQIERVVERGTPKAGDLPIGLYISAPNAGAATAVVASRLQYLAASPNARIVGLSPTVPDPQQPNQLVMTLALEGKEVAVARIVNAIEQNRPLLRFTQWRMSAVKGKAGDVRLEGRLVAVWGSVQ